MPEDLESAGAAEVGGSELGGSEEPVGSGAAQPNYMTRELFEEAMAGYTQSHQERLDKAVSSFGGLQDLVKQMIESNKPQPPPLVPGVKDIEGIDAHGMHGLLKSIVDKHEGTVKELNDKLAKMESSWKQQTETQRIHGYLTKMVDDTAKGYPMLQTPKGRQLFEHLVIANLHGSGNDLKKLNVGGIAQGLDAMISGEVKSRMAAASKAAQAPQAGGAPRAPGAPKPPTRGSPSKPEANPGAGMNLKNFKKAQEEFILKHFPQADD